MHRKHIAFQWLQPTIRENKDSTWSKHIIFVYLHIELIVRLRLNDIQNWQWIRMTVTIIAVYEWSKNMVGARDTQNAEILKTDKGKDRKNGCPSLVAYGSTITRRGKRLGIVISVYNWNKHLNPNMKTIPTKRLDSYFPSGVDKEYKDGWLLKTFLDIHKTMAQNRKRPLIIISVFSVQTKLLFTFRFSFH